MIDALKIINEFKKLTDDERTLRKALEDIGKVLRDAEKHRDEVDKDITFAAAFPADLEKAEAEIQAIKKRRNTLSNKLQAAIKAVEDYRAKHYPALRDEVLRLYANVEAAQAALEDTVSELRNIGTAAARVNIGFSMMDVRSRLIAGHSITVTEQDKEFFTNLKREANNG
jgi:seryl-tRNA synthetase